MIPILLKLILLTWILVIGFKIGSAEDMIWERFGKWAKQKVDDGHKYFNVFICEWCMPSFFSFGGFSFAFGLEIIPFEWNWKYVLLYLLCVAGTSFCTGMSWTIYLTISQIKAYFKFLNETNGAD